MKTHIRPDSFTGSPTPCSRPGPEHTVASPFRFITPWPLLRSLGIALAANVAVATASATIVGSHVFNGDGTVTYSFVVDNSSGAFDVAAFSLEFGFSTPDWNQADTLSGGAVGVPTADWFAEAGTPVTGQSAQDFLSLNVPGEIKAGHTLTGFSFTSRFLPGTISFHEFSAAARCLNGTAIGPVSSVPDGGGTLGLLAVAALAVFGLGTRPLRKTKF